MADLLIVVTLLCLALQAYHYVGYPVLLRLLRAVAARLVRKGAEQPAVSLIVSAYKEAAIIEAKLENALALDYPDLEIIVVADGPDDGTRAIVERYAGRGVVGLFDPVRQGKSAAMTRAAARARGSILVFSDANAFYEPDAVSRLVENFADPEVGCVSGRKMVRAVDAAGNPSALGQSDGFYWRYESMIRRWESDIGSTVSVVGEMLAIRADLFPAIPAAIINDDAFLGLHALRTGQRVIYEPAAVCAEHPSNSMGDDLVRRRRMTAGRYQLLMDPANWPWSQPFAVLCLFSHKMLRLLLPFLMAGALAANAAQVALGPAPAAMQALLALQLAFYGMAVGGYVTERLGRRSRLLHIAYYLTATNIGALRGFFAYVLKTQTALWTRVDRLGPTART
ncbi:glycosyltransferase family 2 protein [Azospirillum sp. sgz302134]